jgi:hypothetical protein
MQKIVGRVEDGKVGEKCEGGLDASGTSLAFLPRSAKEASQQGGPNAGYLSTVGTAREAGGQDHGPGSGPSSICHGSIGKCIPCLKNRVHLFSFSFSPHPCRGMTRQMANLEMRLMNTLRTRANSTGCAHSRDGVTASTGHSTPEQSCPGLFGLLGSVSCLCGSRC